MVAVTILPLVYGLTAGVGVLLVASGLHQDNTAPSRSALSGHAGRARRDNLRRRASLASIGLIGVFVATRWPVAALAAAALGWFSPELLGSSRAVTVGVERTEAIATWTEMLRDTIGAAHGLESAITATATVAPAPIRAEIRSLALRLTHAPLDRALAELAVEFDHPIGDLVVAALTAASRSSVRDLAELLGTLASAARDEASMQLRVDATRARTRTAVRVVAWCTGLTAVGLVVLNPSYVTVYATLTGQVVLAVVAACWCGALGWMNQMSRFDQPERFLTTAVQV